MISPFKFLDAYELRDRDVFFGRDEEIDTLYDMVFQTQLLLIHGLSGTGKTSLIQCGLASRFTGADWLPLFIRRGNDFNVSIQHAVLNVLPLEAQSDQSDLRTNVAALYSQFLRPVYLILDQFEELFILGDLNEQQDLAQSIQTILDIEIPCKVLIVMREEFMGQLYEIEHILPSIYDFRLRLEHMNFKKAREVIGKSFQRFCISLNHPQQDIEKIYTQVSVGKSGIQLPYLQVYLDMFWRDDFKSTYPSQADQDYWQVQMAKKSPEYPPLEFTDKEIEQFGSLQQVFALFLDEQEKLLQAKLQSHFGAKIPPKAVRTILDFFVSEQGTKQPQTYERKEGKIILENLNQAAITKKIPLDAFSFAIDHLCQSRLLRISDTTLELAHDSLAQLIAEERSEAQRRAYGLIVRLKNAQVEYQASKGKTWPNAKLLYEAEDALEELEFDLDLLQFYQKSKKEIDRRAKMRRRKSLLLGLTIAFVCIILSAIFLSISKHNKNVASLISDGLLEDNATDALFSVKNANHLAPKNEAAISAFHKIYTENEFYSHELKHPKQVKGVALSPEQTPHWVYSWCCNVIYRWNWQGIKVDSFTTNNLLDARLSPNGKWLAYIDGQEALNLLDAQNFKVSIPSVNNTNAEYLAFAPNSQYLLLIEKTDKVYKLKQFSIPKLELERVTLLHFEHEISSLAIAPKSRNVWIGFNNGLTVSYSPNFQHIKTEQHHQDKVLSFAFSPVNNEMVSADRNGQLYFWEQNLKIQAHDQRINQLLWIDSTYIFTASKDYTIKSWSTQGKSYATYRAHKRAVLGIAATPDGQYFASAGEDNVVYLWKTESKVIARFGPHQNGPAALLLSRDEKLMISGSDQGENDLGERFNDPNENLDLLLFQRLFSTAPRSISIWDVKQRIKIQDINIHRGGITALAKRGDLWASASKDGAIYLWRDFSSQSPIDSSIKHQNKVTQLAFSKDGQQLMSGEENGQCILWQINSNNKKIILGEESVRGIVYTPDHKWIIALEKELRIYSRQGQALSAITLKNVESIRSLAISPNGNKLLIGEWGTNAKIFDRQGKLLNTLKLPSENKTGAQAINAVTFAPDGITLAIGGEGGMASVFRLFKSKIIEIRTIQHYPQKSILDLEFSTDGKTLFSACNDGWIKQWDLMY